MATLKELSERTGYSQATISRILNGDPELSVSPETRRLVLEEAGNLNYTATRSRRGRNVKSRMRVGLAEMLTPEQQLKDPYYLYLGGFIRQGCAENRYACIPLSASENGFAAPQGKNLDGIAAVGVFTTEQIESLAEISQNVVFLDSSPWEDRFDSVALGYERGISLALEHLLALGHKHIGFIGPEYKLDDRHIPALEVRRQLFTSEMERRGLLNAAAFIESPMEAQAASKAMGEFLKSGVPCPTAFLCANEEEAVGTLLALKDAGIQVPEEISVVSFNDTPRSALVEPALTSVSVDLKEMANSSLRLLQPRASIDGKPPVRTLPLKVVIPLTLTVRDSTGPAPYQE